MATIVGTSGNDTLTGAGGDDLISGLGGNDTINGLAGNDTIDAGDGNDTVYGGTGNDTINGGSGNDQIYGDQGNDTIDGGPGFDYLRYAGHTSGPPTPTQGINVQLLSGTLTDGWGGTDVFINIEGIGGTTPTNGVTLVSDTFDARGFGWSRLDINYGNSGAYNEFWGGAGNDVVTGNGATKIFFDDSSTYMTSGVTVSLVDHSAYLTTADASHYPMNYTLNGGIYAIRGSKLSDVLTGGDPNNGTDKIGGYEQFDPLTGNDTIVGGAGYDKVSYNAYSSSAKTITSIYVDMAAGTVNKTDNDTIPNSYTDHLSGIESIQGSGYSDTYDASGFGTSGSNISVATGWFNSFEGGGGWDHIVGNGDTRLEFNGASSGVYANLNTGVSMDLADFNNSTSVDAALVGIDDFTGVNSLRGGKYNDVLIGGNIKNDGAEFFEGGAGDDLIIGGTGYDRAIYCNDGNINYWLINGTSIHFAVDSSGNQIFNTGIHVNMADGIVTGDPTFSGTDTLRSVEAVWGTQVDDVYDARGFSGTSTNAGSRGTFNEFEGMAGNDTVIGNDFTRVSYMRATSAVYVNLAQGISEDLGIHNGTSSVDTALVGIDTISGTNSIRGSQYDDVLIGGNSSNNLFESFEGRQGNDYIDGGSGFDRARYDRDGATNAWLYDGSTLKFLNDGDPSSHYAFKTGITVNMAAGTVVGDADWTGSDTLKSIESVYGTVLADSYDATGFGSSSVNAGSNGTFNEFEGCAGDDVITGNGNTRISYVDAYSGVYVDLVQGLSHGVLANDVALVGSDTFTGVNAVKGSQFDDVVICGHDSSHEVIDTLAGNDMITIGIGNEVIDGGDGTDTVVYLASSTVITSVGRSDDGLSVLIHATGFGTETLKNTEYIQFGSDPAILLSTFIDGFTPPPLFSTVTNDANAVKSTGCDLDEGSATDTVVTVAPAAVVNSSYIIPDAYVGTYGGLQYQLIDSETNAIVNGARTNDFIKVSDGNSVGKAVDGGGGSDVIDGGVGSTFISGGISHAGSTFFLDGRASGTSWSTITDFNFGSDAATIWGFVKGVSDLNNLFNDANNGGATGYTGLTLHFNNLLADGLNNGSNPDLNSITLSGHTLSDIGATSIDDLNTQIVNASYNAVNQQYEVNSHILIGQTHDTYGDHSYLFIH